MDEEDGRADGETVEGRYVVLSNFMSFSCDENDADKMKLIGDMKALDDFNKALVSDKRLETFLMPMFDGLGMARLVD